MREKNCRGLFFLVLELFFLVIGVCAVIYAVFDYKRKREERELDDYLENSIQ
jgi:hypothetical protein